MLDPVTTGAIAILGTKALDIVGGAVEDHAKDLVKRLFEKGEEIPFDKTEEEALEDAYRNALSSACLRVVDALGKALQLTVSTDEIEGYRESVERFLKDGRVAEHLLETVRDLSDDRFPDPEVLEREWAVCGGEELPIPGLWHMVTANFRKGAREQVFITPQLREVLNARNLDQLRQLGERLLGVQVTVKHEQYVRVMRKTFAPVHLANIAPSYADDPGALVITDVFEPQHLRENPPPVEIAKDELEKLAREGKLDKSDEAVVIALLEEGKGKESAQKLQFQLASYAEQPVRPVLDVVQPAGGKAARTGDHRLIVITGEPGSGKSTLLRYLLLGILDPPPDPSDPARPLAWTEGFTGGEQEHFPFLIELRDYHFTCDAEDEVNSLMDYARYLGEALGYGIDDQWLDRRLQEGPSLVMFDGLDEIFDPDRRDHVMKQIVGFTETYPWARVIVTSRPHGYHEGILRPAGFAHYRLQDLDREQKESFTRAWFRRVFPDSERDAEQRVDRVLSSVDRSPSVRWLAGNPLLLTIMCLIAREKELPRERSRFYEQCIDVLAHQWEINNHLRDENLAFLDVEDKKDLLRHIAFEMQSSDAGLRGNFIAERDLLKLTQAWFEDTFADHTGAKARIAAQRMIRGLWQRNYLLCPRGPKLYGFLHRTFMEFLTAGEYVRRFEKTDDFTLDDMEAVFRGHGNEPEWSEVLRLICGEVGDEFADHLVRTLLFLKDFPENGLTRENQPNHLVLAIRCMGELRGLSKLGELGELALDRCIAFLELSGVWVEMEDFTRGDFLDAVAEIGSRWPRGNLVETRQPVFRENESMSCVYWPEFAVCLSADRDFALKFLGSQTFGLEKDFYESNILREIVRKWPDDTTRQYLRKCAVADELSTLRSKALELLAGHSVWADDSTRLLLSDRAVADEHPAPRSKSLELLAGQAQWADEATRLLLSDRAVADEHSAPRSKSLELLAGHAQWADESTRLLLSERAVNDEDYALRSNALELLAGHDQWINHEETLDSRQRFFEEITRDGTKPEERGLAACLWFGRVNKSDPLADAKRTVFSERANGFHPYLDPHEPVSDEHLAKVARTAGLSDEQRDEMVEQMNAALGWDIRTGFAQKDR